jgi:hypothetical protein
VTEGTPAPIVGRTALTREDGKVLFTATRARVGFFNQARMLLYAAIVAMLSAVLCMQGYGRTPKLLLALAVLLFGDRYGHGQEREISVGDDRVEVREAGLTVAYTWARFDHAYDMADHVVLFAGPGVVVLPKRAFSAGDLERVRTLVTSKLPLQRF